mgnify:CR=1 FL=1
MLELALLLLGLLLIAALWPNPGGTPRQPVDEWTDDEALPTAGRKVVK